jgi:hypothetical protein
MLNQKCLKFPSIMIYVCFFNAESQGYLPEFREDFYGQVSLNK